MAGPVVQYIVVRGDLVSRLGWPAGALIAQACHACTAVTHLFRDDVHMQVYLSDLDNMRKVVLEAENEKSLQELAAKLDENGVLHKLWIEQPENIPTCIAVKPHPKEEIQKYFKKFKLFKGAISGST
ncbi:putative peptidyl-tRNA hydrolase PTRHD1 [Thrips palmi]|uniref:peptidyl-tRNA hydrolase n=1 Tax=Thrips palmi TaxID=161013 RepID=A0A6P9A3V1_THRPL|nr:putative peptidyl-tRNA hydrolase PTRHD1 [Thrips palmi]XP_034251372.1 putative peptidyl-tRNA hydrolase PTRHD1 [Thrips palmi]